MGGRVEHNSAFLSQIPNGAQSSMNMRAGFHMHADAVSTGLREVGEVGVGIVEHQMDVQKRRCGDTHGPDHVRSKTHIGNEYTVHDVEMEPFRSGCVNRSSFGAQASNIGS